MYDLLTKIDFTVDVKFVQTYQERHHKDACCIDLLPSLLTLNKFLLMTLNILALGKCS